MKTGLPQLSSVGACTYVGVYANVNFIGNNLRHVK